MIDIVIPLKSDSHDNHLELRYALRSIEKYLTGWRDVIVLTDKKPNLNVKCGYVSDVPLRKQYSLFKKISVACDFPPISNDFIYWHDDHFLLQPLNANELPDYYDGTLEQALGAAGGTYHTSIQNTIDLIGKDARFFDVHTPCVFNKEKFKELPTYYPEYGYILKSLYMNRFSTNPVELKELKFYRTLSKEGIAHYIKDRPFFSTGANAMKKPMIDFLQELFPEPSRFEKVNVTA